jgi:hypothetical protein
VINYTPVVETVRSMRDGRIQRAWAEVAERLVQLWLDEYTRLHFPHDVVETTAASFSYLFDIGPQRLIAAWGVRRRPRCGQAGRREDGGSPIERRKALPSRSRNSTHLGGPTDINLVPQLGSVNVGPFRPLEKQAVATPGSFYFTYWKYRDNSTQTPSGVDQGLLIPDGTSDIRRHGN